MESEPEVVSMDDLCEDMGLSLFEGAVLEVLKSLRRRFLIEGSGSARFSLHPVVMEYVTARFVEHMSEEHATESLELFVSHVPVKAQAKDYVRNSQVRLILTPLAEHLSS